METKICCKCGGDPKPISEFNKKGNGTQPFCRECSKESFKKHYQDNKQHYLDKNKKLRQINIDYVKGLKLKLKCVRCRESHPATLQFHHRNPTEKEFSISNITSQGYSLESLKKEIEKCDVLCANCHFKEHYNKQSPVA